MVDGPDHFHFRRSGHVNIRFLVVEHRVYPERNFSEQCPIFGWGSTHGVKRQCVFWGSPAWSRSSAWSTSSGCARRVAARGGTHARAHPRRASRAPAGRAHRIAMRPPSAASRPGRGASATGSEARGFSRKTSSKMSSALPTRWTAERAVDKF